MTLGDTCWHLGPKGLKPKLITYRDGLEDRPKVAGKILFGYPSLSPSLHFDYHWVMQGFSTLFHFTL